MLHIEYYTDTAIRTDVWAKATLQADFNMGMGFNTYLQLLPDTDANKVAQAVLEWAVWVASYREGTVEISTNIVPVGEVKLTDYPDLKITFKKAVTESLSPMVSGIALLG